MKSCSRKILELFYNAKHSGRIIKPEAIGRVGEDNDGLVIEVTWRVIDGVIEDAKFRAFANPNAVAITSLMTDYIIGKSVEDARVIGENVITENLDELKPEYLEAFDMVRSAMTEAYNYYLKHQNKVTGTSKVRYNSEVDGIKETKDSEDWLVNQIQTELGESLSANEVRRGRGRPRKEIDPNEIVEIGEKRGRGRPRKERPEGEELVVTEKRGRGRPRKEIDPNEVVEVGEKRGRGRPRKEVDPNEIVEVGEKRGRGRPRKEVDPNEVVEVGEKRGRGRPRKERPEGEELVVTEKRGRGRPRKEIDPNEVVEVGEKRGRGRPKKEIKYNLPSDLDDVVQDKEFDELINGSSNKKQENTFEEDLKIDESENEEDIFNADYDLFKSNIRNILSGKEIETSSNNVEDKFVVESDISTNEDVKEEIVPEKLEKVKDEMASEQSNENAEDLDNVEKKRGRGRPRKEVDPNLVEETHEKRGRGRPKKIVIEMVENSTTPARRVDTVSSLTRSLSSPSGMVKNNQDIMFATKNVTTTNININVTKTTTNMEDNQIESSDYSKNVNVSSVEENSSVAISKDFDYKNETDIDKEDKTNNELDYDDFDDEIEETVEDSHIKDEAPMGGIEDLLKALLNDD